MTDKSTTVKPSKKSRTKIVNESRLVLPQDIEGFSANFRREAARSVGRIMADETKLACFLEMLEKFSEYATDRFEQNGVERKVALAAKAKKLKDAEETALRNAENVIKGKRANAARLNAEIAEHDARMESVK